MQLNLAYFWREILLTQIHVYCCVFIQADVLTEENEDEEAVEASEGNNGFFIKHGTFMGTENEQIASKASDMASSDSDYDTDLETEGNREKKINILI